MRFPLALFPVLLPVTFFLPACGSSDSGATDSSATGAGVGGTSAQGGSSSLGGATGTGGSSTGGAAGHATGGTSTGPGGTSAGVGGTFAGPGGTSAGTGGSSAGKGGASAGTGGNGVGGAAGPGGGGAGGSAGPGGGGMSTGGMSTGGMSSGGAGGGAPAGAIQTVFLILMENHNWSDIKGSASAPYINKTLLAAGAHAEQYKSPKGIHPSEPNYLWLEAGTNFGVLDDSPPSINHQSTTAHLSTQLDAAGVSWRSYQQSMTPGTCPINGKGNYAPKHNPFVFFDDVNGGLDTKNPYCIDHNVEIAQLATDLSAGTAARYNFITPDLCSDMHDSCKPTSDPVKQGDDFLAMLVPMIQASAQYQNGGAIFITWDENEGGDFPIGMIVLSPAAKPGGYSNTIAYTHSSTLRTMQTIFGTSPFLGDAANATDLGDLFATFP